MARLCDDWEQRYGYRPVLAETFVDSGLFRGTCYRAANWTRVGQTAGRPTPYPNGKVSTGKKDIFVYPLCPDWQDILCDEPPGALETRARPETFSNWAEQEFWSLDVFDLRLKARLIQLANDFFAQPGELIPQACGGSKAKTKAAYRFFDNRRIDMDTILKPHVEAAIGRIKEHCVVLAVQDTTTLNYTSHPSTQGLGPIARKSDQSVGLLLHDTMAFTPQGTPLGLLDAQCWARDPHEAGKKYRRKELPIDQKESVKWLNSYRAVAKVQALCPDTLVVSVGDRESDIYELFWEADNTPGGPKLLVRAERSRNRKVGEEDLWERMRREKVAGCQVIHIPQKGGRAARDAKLEVRFLPVELKAPHGKSLKAVKVWAVYALEEGYCEKIKGPLEWMLLTTVEVKTFEQALERLRWYTTRWQIEVYHRILKSGCHIEDRLLNTADRLEACLGIDMVVAWRVHWLHNQGRETPNIPCDTFFTEEQWKVLWEFTTQQPPPDRPPPLQETVRAVAIVGGFLPRKRSMEPGPTTIWRGLILLHYLVMGYRLALSSPRRARGP
jgi:hypothetical protein